MYQSSQSAAIPPGVLPCQRTFGEIVLQRTAIEQEATRMAEVDFAVLEVRLHLQHADAVIELLRHCMCVNAHARS